MQTTVDLRSLEILCRRGWINKAQRGGRHRTNEYRIAFGIDA